MDRSGTITAKEIRKETHVLFFLVSFLVNQRFALFQRETQDSASQIAGDFKWLQTQKHYPLQAAVMKSVAEGTMWSDLLIFGELASGTDAAQRWESFWSLM